MRLTSTNLALILALIVTLSGSVFASKKGSTQHAQHMAVGNITSIDANQVIVSERVKGKEQSMTYKLDSSTQRSGNLTVGTPVTVQYRNENNQNVATTLRERSPNNTSTKTLRKTTKKQ